MPKPKTVKWSVKVKKRGSEYVTEFNVGNQYFDIMVCDPDEDDGIDEAKPRCEWYQYMFLKALENLMASRECVTRASPTCMYLADGTKVVIKREGKRVWMEHVPQAVLRLVRG